MGRPSGQALAEFALVLPLLLLVVVGGLHLGLLIVDRERVVHAAQETAVEAAKPGIGCGNARVTAERIYGATLQTVTCATLGQTVTVSLVHAFPALLPWLPDSVTATERAVIR